MSDLNKFLNESKNSKVNEQRDRVEIESLIDGTQSLNLSLGETQKELFEAALKRREENTHILETWEEFTALYKAEGGFSYCHHCGETECEESIQEETKVTIRNIPLHSEDEEGSCIRCGKPSKKRVLFAQAY